MGIKRCRICGKRFFEGSLLHFGNMPAGAQSFVKEGAAEPDSGRELEIRQCESCGVVQSVSDPVPYYRDVIRASAYSGEMKSFRKKQFEEFVRKYDLKSKKVLEAGCGRGEYMTLMSEAGAEVYGVEHLDESVQECLRSGLNVERLFFEDEDTVLEKSPFDAFYILNFLEHIPDIPLFLRILRSNLTSGATGLVEVPNFEMMLRKKQFSEFIADHLYYFTPASLRITLESNGFDVIGERVIWHEYIISFTVRKREAVDLSGFKKQQEIFISELHKYMDNYKKIAVWGAGHQALAILSLANAGRKVAFVVDSAPFKQGLFTPVTHVPIVSPEFMADHLPDAVIVMAGGYSDEVAGIIKERYAGAVDIAIVRNDRLEIVE